jgi:hypothetical protein
MVSQPGFARAWLRQRVAGEAAISAIEEAELRRLGPAEALRLSDALLSVTPSGLTRPVSGLIEQQRIFARARR